MLGDIKKNIGKENIKSKLHVSNFKLVKDKERESFLLLSEMIKVITNRLTTKIKCKMYLRFLRY